ncbi:helix-hairpin-helix domain-containing protein [Sporomusa aerivorans]|uniref:helix-hairpin-helix domain-containing protein n=1 Tax=Sporomusa aerivorans TaxID=204936 RepID=UPI00352B4DA6
MGFLQKKLVIIIALACGILAYSFYSFIEKTGDGQNVNPPAAPKSASPVARQNDADSEIFIYVSGGVIKPGVYKLSQGSRVVDVVNLAGGFAPGADAAKINLAMLLKDEMQIHVPYMNTVAVPSANAPLGSKTSGNDGGLVNINTASKTELDQLPGIGPALAERIIEYRNANGSFRDTAELKKVPGIGEAKYNQFKAKVTI